MRRTADSSFVRLSAWLSQLLLVTLLLVAVAPRAHSQVVTPGEIYSLRVMFNHGCYDAIIDRTSAILSRSREPIPPVQYLRGYSFLKIAAFGDAEADLAPLGDYHPWEKMVFGN